MRFMSLALQQSKTFARALEAVGVDVVSRAPVVITRRFPVLGAVRFASRIGIADLGARPRLINAEEDAPACYCAAGYRQIITPAHIARWNLAAPDRVGRMTGTWRNQWRKGAQAGLRLREQVWRGEEHWLFARAAEVARARKFRPLPHNVIATYAAVDADAALLFEAYAKGTPVAACLVLRHGRAATYQVAWASALGKHMNAPRVVLAHAAERLAALGHSRFDLGVIDTQTAPGLARFKLGTGADVVRLGGTWVHLGRARPLAPAAPMA